MDPPSYTIACVLDFQALGAWYDWIKNWRAANQPLQLNDLPGEALRLILDRTSLEDRSILRNTSYRLRALIDKNPVECKTLNLCFSCKYLKLTIDNEVIMAEAFDPSQ